MAYTTYGAFISGLATLPVAGIKRSYGAPPSQPLTTADLPALYPRLPKGEKGLATLTGLTEMSMATCDLVIAVQPLGLRTNTLNYGAALTIMQSLEEQLAAHTLALGIDGWEIRVIEEWQSESAGMWQVVATVRASG
jgi:hypothetical protein